MTKQTKGQQTINNNQQELPSLHYAKVKHQGDVIFESTVIESKGLTSREAIRNFDHIRKTMRIKTNG